MKMSRKCILTCGLLALVIAMPASAGSDLITFGFTDLRSDYLFATRVLTIVERTGGGLHTNGDVTRVVDPNAGDSASFDFSGGFGSAGIDVSLTLAAMGVGQTAASGTVTITDVNGDQITTTTNGIFVENFAGEVQYEGFLKNIVLPVNSFDGTTGSIDISPGSFGTSQFSGTVIIIKFDGPGPGLGMFEVGTGFSDVSVRNFDGSIVPEPAAAMLATIGFVAGARRKRTARQGK